MREILGYLRTVLFGPEWGVVMGEWGHRKEADEKLFGANWFSGGAQNVPSQPKPVKLPSPAPVQIPTPPPPPPMPAPLPTQSKLEVQQAEDDQRAQALQRKGMSQTLIAGDTGGYLSPSTDGTKKSLLG